MVFLNQITPFFVRNTLISNITRVKQCMIVLQVDDADS